MSTSSKSPSESLRRASEELLECLHTGQQASLSDFQERHPELGENLAKLFQNTIRIRDSAESLELSPVSFRRRIGDYRIVRELGRGGMGVVYEAEQESLARRVALKIVPPSVTYDSPSLERFRREARAAARLHHTNIVPVHEVGQDGDICFYAMQYIQGQSLEQWIEQRTKLSEGEERETASDYRGVARWAHQVATALAYAHERGIVHRDIKPSNLLLDPSGIVWITDFGLAKSIGDDHTQAGELMGTVRYMAPERFAGQGDHRADIYSLGVTLYELLLLRPAYSASDHVQAMDEVRRTDPPAPRKIDPHLPRDLEVIVLKAIDKDPSRRYQSAAELAEDLRRFLADEPILARPVSSMQRLVRAARRNPKLARMIYLVIGLGLTLIIGAIASAISFHRLAEQQRLQAEIARLAEKDAKAAHLLADGQTQTAQEISTFLLGLLDEADPLGLSGVGFGKRKLGDQRRTPLEMLDQCADKLKTALRDRPLVRAALLDKVGAVYVSFGQLQKAKTHLDEALAIRRETLPANHVDLAETWHHVGYLNHAQLRFEQAENAYRNALKARQEVLGEEHALTAQTMIHLGFLYALDSEFKDGESLLRRALEIQARNHGKKSREYGMALVALGQWYLRRNEIPKVLPLVADGQALLNELGDEKKLGTAINDFIQGQLARHLKLPKVAASRYLSALAIGEPWLGETHFFAVMARNELGLLYLQDLNDDAKAEEQFRIVLARLKGIGAEYEHSAGGVAMQLGRALRNQNRFDEAEPVLQQAAQIMREHGGDLGRCLHILGEVQFRNNKPKEAETSLEEAVAARKRRSGENKYWYGRALDYYVVILLHQQKTEKAREALWRNLPDLDQNTAADPEFYFWHACRRARLYTLLPNETQRLREELLGEAIQSLELAIQVGFKDAKAMNAYTPPVLRSHPAFGPLLARIETSK